MMGRPQDPRRLAAIVILIASLLAVAATTAAAPEASLRERLDHALFGKKPAKQTSALAVDLRTGETIYRHDADTPLIPASNAKLWTTAAALDLLGEEYEFTTRLVGRGRLEGGDWVGDLKVIGGGDPSIGGRFHDGDPTAVLKGWGKHLAARGARRVTGDIIIDDTFFDREYSLPSWPRDDPAKAYLAPMAGLSFNENCVELLIAPAGGGVRVTSVPETDYITVRNTCTLTAVEKDQLIRVHRVPGGNRFNVSGRVWKGSGGYKSSFAVHDPALYFGTVLREVLQREGIRVEGRVRREAAAGPKGSEAIPPGGLGEEWVDLDLHRSPLLQSVETANRRSQNFHAEQILKTLGRVKGGEGSFASGSRVVEGFLAKIGLQKGSYDVADGSGLSRENRISARGIVTILRHMAHGRHGEAYLSSLAISGDPDGTLRRRLRSEKTKGKVRAKTGSLRGVSCLSGIVATPLGELVAFSILMNGTAQSGAARQAQDRFCTVLTDYASD